MLKTQRGKPATVASLNFMVEYLRCFLLHSSSMLLLFVMAHVRAREEAASTQYQDQNMRVRGPRAAQASWSLHSRVMDTVSYLQRLGWMGQLLLGRLSFMVGY